MRRSVIGLTLVVLAGCASEPAATHPPAGPWTPAPDVPTAAELTCASDGTVTLSGDTVQPRPDGVHLRVVNGFDEPVSVEGFDADPGTTDWVFSQPPGTMQLMCWPFSQHSSGQEPPRHPLQIVDPMGLYVDGSVACEFNGSSIIDYAEAPIDLGPPPRKVAEELITGRQPDDVLRVSGYPDQEAGSFIVIRDGDVVASYGIVRFEGKPWRIGSAQVCTGTGLRFEGRSFG